ncbi:hypothetical protein J3R83DRAFT_14043 [Lanmaoa asiatica]|nr:hypothetical protein J3R83DRAFT_14043 [Lanmaoa asiatica]
MATLDKPSYQTQEACSPNVLVVGETGVGKSSIINLIARQSLADVSAGVSVGTTGCTTEAAPYDVVLTDHQGLDCPIHLFDTVGLNEPSVSKDDYLTAVEKAYVLITELRCRGGIHLLLFCVRGDKITDVTQSNYQFVLQHVVPEPSSCGTRRHWDGERTPDEELVDQEYRVTRAVQSLQVVYFARLCHSNSWLE